MCENNTLPDVGFISRSPASIEAGETVLMYQNIKYSHQNCFFFKMSPSLVFLIIIIVSSISFSFFFFYKFKPFFVFINFVKMFFISKVSVEH